MASIDDVRSEVATATRLLHELGLASGIRASVGHVSMRLPDNPNHFVVKGRGYRLDALAKIQPQDLVECDLEGELVDGPANIVPCFEVKIHSCILRARPDIQSVVHVHPEFSVLLTVLGKRLRPMSPEASLLVLNPIPVYPHQKIVTTDEEGNELARTLGQSPAAMLFGHGTVTVGASPEESVSRILQLEYQAKMNYYAYSVAGMNHPYVPDELVKEARAGGGRSQFELPHFKRAFEKAGPPLYSGVWEYWKELVND